MTRFPNRSDSYDPHTWPEPGQFKVPNASARDPFRGKRTLLWVMSAAILLGGAAASWLTRMPPDEPAGTIAGG